MFLDINYNKMEFNNIPNESYIVNRKDGSKKLIFDSRSVAVNAVIIFVDKVNNNVYVLASERGPNAADFQGKMNVVAGYLDWNETGTEAVYRETWEETGLDLIKFKKNQEVLLDNLEQPWDVKTDPSENRENVSLRYGLIVSGTDLPSLTTENNEVEGEVSYAKWIPLEKIDNYSWAFNHDQLIGEYSKNLLRL